MKQVFHKIESNYEPLKLNNTIRALKNWLCYLECCKIDEVDKHLIKDLRRHKDRLLNLRKEQWIKNNPEVKIE